MAKLKLIFNLSSVQLTIPTMADLYDTLQSDITIAHSLPKDFTDDDMKIHIENSGKNLSFFA